FSHVASRGDDARLERVAEQRESTAEQHREEGAGHELAAPAAGRHGCELGREREPRNRRADCRSLDHLSHDLVVRKGGPIGGNRGVRLECPGTHGGPRRRGHDGACAARLLLEMLTTEAAEVLTGGHDRSGPRAKGRPLGGRKERARRLYSSSSLLRIITHGPASATERRLVRGKPPHHL